MRMLAEDCTDEEIGQLLELAFRDFTPDTPVFSQETSNRMRQQVLGSKPAAGRVFRLLRRSVAAAVIICIAGIGLWFALHQKHPGTIASAEAIVPGGNKATLTLGNGRIVVLDSMPVTDTITEQGVHIINLNSGSLAYNDNAAAVDAPMIFNTLATPRGGQYQVRLPDGSLVWLNASSSVRFPVRFKGAERRVEVSGEAYFEIKENAAMPFHVQVNSGTGDSLDIAVLGTHFNIMAYADEQMIQTSLLEGSIRVTTHTKGLPASLLLTPGKQAQWNKTDQQLKLLQADMQQVMAWRNGFFYFNGSDIRTIMRQLSRWYDIDVIYESEYRGQDFEGELPRNESVTRILKTLEATGVVQFRIKGKTIIVIPKKQEG